MIKNHLNCCEKNANHLSLHPRMTMEHALLKSKIKIFKRQEERSYPIFAFEANLVLSLSYPCPEEPLSTGRIQNQNHNLGAFSREFFTKPRFIRTFVPKQFSLRYLQY